MINRKDFLYQKKKLIKIIIKLKINFRIVTFPQKKEKFQFFLSFFFHKDLSQIRLQ